MMENLTWTCHICGVERPDALIAVKKHDRSAGMNLPPGTWNENVRYCVDKPDCAAKAETFTFMPDAK